MGAVPTTPPSSRSLLRSAAAHAVPVSLRRRVWYRRRHGRGLPLLHPTTFMEKVNWRIVHDRRPLLEGTCDKLEMKARATAAAGDLVRVPATLWSGTDVRELAHADLPEHWVLKPNHSTGVVHFGHGRPDVEELADVTEGWLDDSHWRRTGEWAYASARPLLVAEELVGRPGEVPADYKVFVFDGAPRLVQVHTGRFTDHRTRTYDPDWQELPWQSDLLSGPRVDRPRRLADMVEAAGRLGQGFDMLRVDFYEEGGELWFGELTPYPGSGMVVLPAPLDAFLGQWWTLPPASGHLLRRAA